MLFLFTERIILGLCPGNPECEWEYTRDNTFTRSPAPSSNSVINLVNEPTDMSVCLSIFLDVLSVVCLFVCLHLSICLSVSLSIYSVSLSHCLSVFLLSSC